MNAYLLLLAELLVSLLASLAVLRVLASPLVRTLGRICPDEAAAQFWRSYTQIMVVIAPLVLVLIANFLSRYSDPLDSLRVTLLAALIGLMAGMTLIGSRLGSFIQVPDRFGGRI